MQLEQLFEGTEIGDIADFPKMLRYLNRELERISILSQVSDSQPMQGPTGLVYGTEYDSAQDKLLVKKKTIEASTIKVTSAFSAETFQDLKAQYGEDFEEIVGHYIANLISLQRDNNFITKLKLEASTGADMLFNPADFKDWAGITNNILIKINRERFKLIKETQRPLKTWCIVTMNIANAIFSNSQVGGNHSQPEESSLGSTFLGHIAGMDYYLDLDYAPLGANIDYFIVGLYGNGIDGSSTIHSPYINDFNWYTNPDNGEKYLQIINRSSWCFNPIDPNTDTGSNDSTFTRTATIDLSGFDTV